MLARIVQELRGGERGISGLESAIILIAFVVVASIFAYTVLAAGIFSAQKTQEAFMMGLQVARSAVGISGPVIAKDTDSDGQVEQIIFILINTGSGEGIDFRVTTDLDADGLLSDEANQVHRTIISYTDKTQRIDDITWTKTALGKGDGDDLLEDRERFQITVDLTALTTSLDAYDTFTLEVRPASGTALVIERSIPAQVDPVMDLR